MTIAIAEKIPSTERHRTMNMLLAAASAALAAAAMLAVLRGRAHWGEVAPLVWAHIVSIVIATALTPVMLLWRKGNRRHRQLGYVWVGAMLLAAVTSLFFNTRATAGWGMFTGDFSPIHILSGIVIIMVPRLVMYARVHNHHAHQRTVHGLVIGALLLAGFFTFPFDRMLGQWLFN